MARPQNESYELSDGEKRDLIELIQTGKPLPERYRFLLFEDKREVELVWNGKTREVANVILPFQTLEHVDEPRKEERTQEEMFDLRGRRQEGWTNKLIWGDNKLILSSLRGGGLRREIEEAGGLKLIYFDPPFDVGADFSIDIEVGDETFHKDANLLEQIAYRDTWGRGGDSFLSMFFERLIIMKDLMSMDGTIFVHCDWRLNSAIRLVLDEVFGADRHLNEIQWCYSIGGKGESRFARKHDTILFYSKSDSYFFDGKNPKVVVPRKKGSHMRVLVDEKGNEYQEKTDRRTGKVYRYPVSAGKIPEDYWTDIEQLNREDSERLPFPTQKPERLVERIIAAASENSDLVADFFCGSGTTAAVAEKLGRKWIAADLGKFAIHTTRKRLIQVQRELGAEGKLFRPFEVLNLGRYERQAYLNVSPRLSTNRREATLAIKEKEFRDLILRAYRAQQLEGDSFFHGKLGSRLVVIGPINLPVGRLFVEEVIVECRRIGATQADILAFEFEMGLFPAVLDEARAKGLDLAPKTIPPEVFDKRAVDKGEVRFFDVSYIEATPRFSSDGRSVAVELTDFSVYYSQGVANELVANLRNGKSEVICEQGQLIKINKDKNGVVTREVLTKEWTDWVDYWAVDFNYETRKEIVRFAKRIGEDAKIPGVVVDEGEFLDYEERWTGSYIFENKWQTFRTRKNRELELVTAQHTYEEPGRYVIAVKVIDIFGNDTMTLIPINIS
ncbi:MAG: site-specific DNA-methyltransferase [Actinomycetota bacterium]